MLNSQKRRQSKYSKTLDYCKAPHPTLKGVICGRSLGHDGEHQVIVRWEQESPPPLGINVTETITVEDKFGG
jgi:hypothetical protein